MNRPIAGDFPSIAAGMGAPASDPADFINLMN
jgi:hypothetical protein